MSSDSVVTGHCTMPTTMKRKRSRDPYLTEKVYRRPNVICRVETFGRICRSFDDIRRRWVIEMRFGGLLHLVDRHLPRPLCYWLMTRIDSVNEMLIVGGRIYSLSCNQVRWILGLPKGKLRVPTEFDSQNLKNNLLEFENKFGEIRMSIKGSVGTRKSVGVTPFVVDRLMRKFDAFEVVEFKRLFLMASLELVLCPTQCSRFPNDLLPSLGCAEQSRRYNWCGFVLEKLMASMSRFGRRFYRDGFAGGCGGCTLFLAIFYLDRLDRKPISWGTTPRVKVWTDDEMQKACAADRCCGGGDFGCAGVLDVAYDESHPRDARDTEVTSDVESVEAHF